jgi:hypothetical protein
MIGFIGASLELQSIVTAHTLNSFCLTNLSEKSVTEISWTELTSMWTEYRSPSRTESCYSVLSVAAEATEPLPSKLTSASAATPAFRQCLRSRCLATDCSVTV